MITIPAVSADATYWAVVSKEKQSYVVTFYNENDQVLKSQPYEYGEQPWCEYAGPVDRSLAFVGKAFFIELFEYPLCPVVVLGVAG